LRVKVFHYNPTSQHVQVVAGVVKDKVPITQTTIYKKHKE